MAIIAKVIVWCTFDVVGFHCWPKAPKNVGYLRTAHRHIFKFKVGVEVTKQNRQIEFQTLKADAIERLLKCYDTLEYAVEREHAIDFGNNSCEMIASRLAEALEEDTTTVTNASYRAKFVEVSEDGENGAIVEFD